jgi:hypothetical protein
MWIWKPIGMGDSSDDEARVSAVFSELELFMSFPSSVAVSRMRGGWR